jgi:hypothetical protein
MVWKGRDVAAGGRADAGARASRAAGLSALRQPGAYLLYAGAVARVLGGAAGLFGQAAALGATGEGGDFAEE